MDAIEAKNTIHSLNKKRAFNDYLIKALDGTLNIEEFKEECKDLLEFVQKLLVEPNIPQPVIVAAMDARNLVLSTISGIIDILSLGESKRKFL